MTELKIGEIYCNTSGKAIDLFDELTMGYYTPFGTVSSHNLHAEPFMVLSYILDPNYNEIRWLVQILIEEKVKWFIYYPKRIRMFLVKDLPRG